MEHVIQIRIMDYAGSGFAFLPLTTKQYGKTDEDRKMKNEWSDVIKNFINKILPSGSVVLHKYVIAKPVKE